MRLSFLKLTVLLLVSMLSAGHPLSGQLPAAPMKRLQGMYRYAADQLPRILNLIPRDEEEKYGFKSREEFKKAVLGIAYQEYSLNEGAPTGFWRVPVMVDGENKVLLSLSKKSGKWASTGFGAARLARELGFYERHFTAQKPSWGRIVRDDEMTCDYIQFDPKSEAKLEGVLYPLESAARIMLRSRNSINKHGYSVVEIKAFRSQFKKRVYQEKRPGKKNKGRGGKQ